ncbi:MAG: TlpA disulfide reductase family protein [Sedimentisphaerales bacterium]|jgi:peroxiredoxin
MAHGKTKFVIWLGVAVLAAGVTIGCKKEPQSRQVVAEPVNTVHPRQTGAPNLPAATPTATAIPTTEPEKPTLKKIIANKWSWGPVYTDWYGKEAPDFTVVDITGRKCTLSEYRGKNVILIFWATWCRPCLMEIPHLLELRKTIGEDKLAMLAISYIDPINSADKIKEFIAANPVINYTVTATDMATMPKPYNLINAIPCSFFIDPQGRVKLATEGLVPLPDMKAIIEAER